MLIPPSTVRLATAPAFELVTDRMVAAASLRSTVYVPAAVRWSVVSVAAMLRTALAESSVKPPAAPEASVTAPEPVTRLLGLRLVRLAPEIAGSVPVRLPAVRLVRAEPLRAGKAPVPVVCTSWLVPLKLLPCLVRAASLDKLAELICVPPTLNILPAPASILPVTARLATLTPLEFLTLSVEVAAVDRSMAKAVAAFWMAVVLAPMVRLPLVESSVSVLAAPELKATAPAPV